MNIGNTYAEAYAKRAAAARRGRGETSEAGKALKISQAERQTDRPIDPQNRYIVNAWACTRARKRVVWWRDAEQPLFAGIAVAIAIAAQHKQVVHFMGSLPLHYIIQWRTPPLPPVERERDGRRAHALAKALKFAQLLALCQCPGPSRPRRNFFKMRGNPIMGDLSLPLSLSLCCFAG